MVFRCAEGRDYSEGSIENDIGKIKNDLDYFNNVLSDFENDNMTFCMIMNRYGPRALV